MRRRGFPLFPMGGYGMGMGMGGLMGDLVAGGIGYLMGKQSAQQAPQYQTPQYQPPQQAPQYQTPQYQASAATPNQQVAASGVNERLAQLKLLGHLRDSSLLTNDEFEAEKQKIMQG
jgi:hypothetical protein